MDNWLKLQDKQLGPEEAPQDPFGNLQPLVAQYMRNKYSKQDAQKDVDSANQMSALAGMSDMLVNSAAPKVFQNRMQDLGKAPTIMEQPKQHTDVSGLQKQAQMKLQQANSDEDNAVKMAFEQRKQELANKLAAEKMAADEAYRTKDLELKERGIDAQSRSRNAYADMQNWLAQEKLKLEKDKFAAEQNKPKPLTPAEQKKITTSQEVDYRVNSINSALDRLEKNVKDNGTFEMFGNASTDMDKDLYNVALDYAKLVDPESVAREGEVAAAQKYMLPIKGLTTQNATAIDAIKSMRDTVKKRAADMRGPAQTLSTEDQQALDWAKANPTDPRAAQILKLHGG